MLRGFCVSVANACQRDIGDVESIGRAGIGFTRTRAFLAVKEGLQI